MLVLGKTLQPSLMFAGEAVKSFIVQAPEANVMKIPKYFTVVNYYGNFNPTFSRVEIWR